MSKFLARLNLAFFAKLLFSFMFLISLWILYVSKGETLDLIDPINALIAALGTTAVALTPFVIAKNAAILYWNS